MNPAFWRGRRVFLTGHTGFKGSWMSLWLQSLGAELVGFALDPPTDPSLFVDARVAEGMISIEGNIRDLEDLRQAMQEAQPEIVFHMAAQSLVRYSYKDPVETYATNIMGTVHMFEAVRNCDGVRAVINVTTDKCYENREWLWGYRENEPLGGYDPYSSSKACSELVTAAYRNSYFNIADYKKHGVAVASARAGNVIGGGDWAADRLIPDCIRALLANKEIMIRNPKAIRPWQHVLEPLRGYLMLAERLYNKGTKYTGAWNFGPDDADAEPVEWIVKSLCEKWGGNAAYTVDKGRHPHEASYLRLDCSKAKLELGWKPKWDIEKAIDSVVDWTMVYNKGKDLRQTCLTQIEHYQSNV